MDLLIKVFTAIAMIKDQLSFLFLSKKLEDYLELSQIFLGNLQNNGKVFIKMETHLYFLLDQMDLYQSLTMLRIKINMKLVIVMIEWLILLLLLSLVTIVMMLLNNHLIIILVIWIKDFPTKTMEWVHKRTRNIWQVNSIFQYKKWKFIK